MNIGDLFFAFRGDGTGLQVDAQKAGAAAADAFGLKYGQRLKVVAGAGKALGVSVAAGAAIAGRGLLELDSITADYAATTGATADEAARAGKAINAMGGRNLQSLREIGDTLTVVHTDLGLAGEQAEKTTEKFLKYGIATKQGPAAAVKDFDDILDAWGLTADHSDEIMDKLIISHQKYGGSIDANQKALAAMAPQLKALNLGIDDGIGLLDLFAASGLDATAGQKALNAAIKNLPSGESLTQFIARLSAVKDDGERARLAMQVFGSKAGAGLANAIRPGIDSLDTFKVSSDEAAGATEKAADIIESKFSNQVVLKIKAVGAAIIGVGQTIGPLGSALTGLVSLGGALGFDKLVPKLASGLSGLWSKVAGTALVSGAIGAAGDKAATLYLKALIAGDALSGALSSAWNAISGAVGGAAKKAGQVLGAIYGAAVGFAAEVTEFVTEKWRDLLKSAAVKGLALKAGHVLGGIYGAAVGFSARLTEAITEGWSRIIGAPVIRAIVKRAATAAAGWYLAALLIGDGISTALSGAWAATGGRLIAASQVAGTTAGSAFAFAATAAIVAAPLAVLYVAIQVADDVRKAKSTFADQITRVVQEGSVEALQTAKKAIETQIASQKLFGIIPFQFAGEVDAMKRELDRINAELAAKAAETALVAGFAGQHAGQAIGEAWSGGVAAGVTSKTPALRAAVDTTLRDAFGLHGKAWAAAAKRLGYLAGGATAQGIRDSESLVDQSWQTLLDAIKNVESPAKRAARLLGRLTSKQLAAGLADGRDEVKADAEYTFQVTIDELNKIVDAGGKIGKKGMAALHAAMHSKTPAIAEAARDLYHKVAGQLGKIPAAGTKSGKDTAANVAAQLDAGKGKVGAAAARLAAAVAQSIFARITHDGHAAAKSGNGPVAFAAGSPYVPYTQVALIHQGERILTATENAAVSSGQAVLAARVSGPGDSGGDTYIFDVDMESVPQARNPIDVARQLARYAQQGAFRPVAAVRR